MQTLQEIRPEPTLARCLVCGKEQPAWSRFCRDCGHPLGAEEEQPTQASTSEVVLMPSPAEAQAPEEAGFPALPGGVPGAGVLIEFSGAYGYGAGMPGTQPGFQGVPATWQGTPAVPQPPPRKRRSLRAAVRKRLNPRVIAVVVGVIVVLASASGGAYIFTRPRPVIQVTTDQPTGSRLTGSPDTDLQVTGRDFSANSAIFFLLDGKAAPGARQVTSDSHGGFFALLTITDDWSFSTHTLTARDAQGYATHDGVTVQVVPQPVLSVDSGYVEGSTPAGSVGTTFDVSGKRFTPNAAVTLLLDGKPQTLSQPLTSDATGHISAGLAVTADWALGGHVLTARDSQGYVTRSPTPLVVVRPGEADTPGPNGAPADDATFTLYFNVQASDLISGQKLSFQVFANITGRPDPAGGAVCNLAYDNNRPFTTKGQFSNGEKYTETMTTTCAGTYKSGKISYTETATSDQFKLASGVVCSTRHHFAYNVITGSYTTSGFRGRYVSPGAVIPCSDGSSIIYDPLAGSWTAFG
ncbi:MAG TPA: hypothetical protein VFU69_05400 [Ktedonobacterales bacterium]|nr:hypothetical protein [Ktedonobacterales bacterium]